MVDGKSQPAAQAQLDRKWETMQAHIDEVISTWQVYERAHGPQKKQNARTRSMTGRVRNLLSRLYTWPTLQKQIEYNASLARTVRELSRQLAELQARTGVQAVLTSGLISRQADATPEDISIELEDLRARFEALEHQHHTDD
jgi:hypothetical protein